MPPRGIRTFNSNPVLLKLLPPKGNTVANPVLAGPKPGKHAKPAAKDSAHPCGPFFDPWDTWNRSKQSPAPSLASGSTARSVQGPIEARFAEQAEKIQKMEVAMRQLHVTQCQIKTDCDKGFTAVAQKEQQLESAIVQVKHDLENSFANAIK